MKIDLDWIQEELDAGREVELECIDKDGFINRKHGLYSEDNTGILESELIVLEVHGGFIKIKDTSSNIVYSEFKYFRIKQTPTFDDLIDVAVRAVKNRVMFTMSIGDNKRKGRYLNYAVNGNSPTESFYESDDDYQACIDFINSLYTETFVIDSEEDIKRIEKDASVVLSNEMEVIASSDAFKIYNGWSVRFGEIKQGTLTNFSFLKGATVTQQKGNK